VAYNYLLELYDTIVQRRREAQQSARTAADYRQGQIEALDEFERFLRDTYHGQLPRRIRQRAERAEASRDDKSADE
jgi:hypothetical protein